MANSVNGAFNEFMKNIVNLDSEKTKKARASRDWLVEKIHTFSEKDDFPNLCDEFDKYFGSFARKTKIRELDDIDMMIGLNAQGSSYLDSGGKVELTVASDANNLLDLCHDNTQKLNSRKVINRFISSLKDISQYGNAEMNRRGEAATLKLNSYTWNFDIVPCFFTKPEYDGRTYYLIPDGSGNWKKTDPRIDGERVSIINQKHSGKVLNIIRIMKYWNRRATMPSMGSYAFECMILDYYSSKENCSDYIDLEVKYLFQHIYTAVYSSIYDPKNIQGDLNTLIDTDRTKISNRALADYRKAVEASNKEQAGDHKAAIKKWKEIFGSEFPDCTE